MSLSELVIRKPVPADGPAIGAVHVDAWQHAYADLMPADFLAGMDAERSGEQWQRILRLPPDGNDYRVAELDGRLIGFAVVGDPRDDVPAGTGELAAINFAHDAWGKGYGTQLFAHAVTVLKDRRFSGAYLWVAAGNERAIAFYRHRGWTDDGIDKADDRRGFIVRERRMSVRF